MEGDVDHELTVVVQRLDRLTEEESRIATAQTLEVLYSLVQNMRAVMDGEKMHYVNFLLAVECSSLKMAGRWCTMSKVLLVRFASHNEATSCLTEH